MSDPIVILTEEPLGADDRVNIERLVDGGDAPLVVLVPANTERHLLVDFLENLSRTVASTILHHEQFYRLVCRVRSPAVDRSPATRPANSSPTE